MCSIQTLAVPVTASRGVPDISRVPHVDTVGIEERCSRFQSRSIKRESKVEGLKHVLSMIDLTTL